LCPDDPTASGAPSINSTTGVLLIEGQIETRGMLHFCLEQEGYTVTEAATSTDAIECATRSTPGAVLLDLDMSTLDAFGLLLQLRERSRSYIIVFSKHDDASRRLCALNAGANDYLVRPLHLPELAARLRAAQCLAPTPVSPLFKAGELTVDLSSRTVKVTNRSVKLTATEFSLLELFVRNAGKVLTHSQILSEIWGPRMVKRLEYLRVYLKSLRSKIEVNPDTPQLLVTERYIGYRLALPEI
jgi:two-component system KDP operon response regulator KdpE